MTKSYRVTFRTADERGTADYVRDVVAESLTAAIEQARWQLIAANHDNTQYRAYMAVEIER